MLPFVKIKQLIPSRFLRYYRNSIRRSESLVRDDTFNGMRLIFLGTSSGQPTRTRNVSSIILHLKTGEQWMFDCGEGTQHRMKFCEKVNLGNISKIFITHMHGDHTFGLPGVLASLTIGDPFHKELELYGPKGLQEYVLNSLDRTHSHYPREKLKFNEFVPENSMSTTSKDNVCLDERGRGVIFESDIFKISVALIKHTIPCYGYVIEEKNEKGTVNVEKLQSLGINPGRIYRNIVSQWKNDMITLPGDILVPQNEIFGPDKKGRKVVILGDTCDPSNVLDLGRHADLLVHESTLRNEFQKKAVLRGHSTFAMAAKFAAQMDCKNLIVTHFSTSMNDEDLEEESRSASSHFKGGFEVAHDFDIFDVLQK